MARVFKIRSDGSSTKKAGGYVRPYLGAQQEDRVCIGVGGGSPFNGYVLKLNRVEAKRIRDFLSTYLESPEPPEQEHGLSG